MGPLISLLGVILFILGIIVYSDEKEKIDEIKKEYTCEIQKQIQAIGNDLHRFEQRVFKLEQKYFSKGEEK